MSGDREERLREKHSPHHEPKTPDPVPRTPPVGTPDEPSYVSVVPDPLVEMHELLTRTNYWGERADLKATILMSGVTAVFGTELIAIGGLIDWVKEAGGIRWLPLSVLVVSLIVLLMAGLMGGRSFYPQLGEAYVFEGTIAPGDLLYFARLRTMPRERIAAEVRKAIAEETLIDHYAEQLQLNAEVVYQKFVRLQVGMKLFALAIGVALIGLISWLGLTVG
jgi:hypothetical protein